LATLFEEQNVKLVVIDSIAAVFRAEATKSIKVSVWELYPDLSLMDWIGIDCCHVKGSE
jgi:hypothetical protein